MPSKKELIAYGRTEQEVADEIGADWLIYQDLDDLVESCREGNSNITQFDCSVFDGNYVTGDINQAYLEQLERLRGNDGEHATDLTEESTVGLHNDIS